MTASSARWWSELQTFRPVDALLRNFVFYLLPAVLFLVAAAVYAWRPRHRPAQLMLAVSALLTAGTGSDPLGLRVIDLAGGRGVGFYVVSEIANCLMWSSLLYFALIFPEPPVRLARRPHLFGRSTPCRFCFTRAAWSWWVGPPPLR